MLNVQLASLLHLGFVRSHWHMIWGGGPFACINSTDGTLSSKLTTKMISCVVTVRSRVLWDPWCGCDPTSFGFCQRVVFLHARNVSLTGFAENKRARDSGPSVRAGTQARFWTVHPGVPQLQVLKKAGENVQMTCLMAQILGGNLLIREKGPSVHIFAFQVEVSVPGRSVLRFAASACLKWEREQKHSACKPLHVCKLYVRTSILRKNIDQQLILEHFNNSALQCYQTQNLSRRLPVSSQAFLTDPLALFALGETGPDSGV